MAEEVILFPEYHLGGMKFAEKTEIDLILKSDEVAAKTNRIFDVLTQLLLVAPVKPFFNGEFRRF